MQIEPTQSDFIIVFLLLNITIAISYYYYKKRKVSFLPWLASLVFCLFAKWETDYFTFQSTFVHGIREDYKDPIYYYLQYFSFENYLIFRTWIWGVSLLLLYGLCNKLRVATPVAIFILASSFLMTFSYARVTLGMTAYFYGLSILIFNRKTIYNISITLGLFILSFMAHRSMLPIILLSPFAIVSLNKKYYVILLALIIPLQYYVTTFMGQLSTEYIQTGGSFSGFTESAEHYASFNYNTSDFNWKFALVSYLRYISIYLILGVVSKSLLMSNYSKRIPFHYKRLLMVTALVVLLASIFLLNPSESAGALYIIGYRYLYVAIIPLTILLAYVVQKHACKKWHFWLPILLSLAYQEGYIIGKILSF